MFFMKNQTNSCIFARVWDRERKKILIYMKCRLFFILVVAVASLQACGSGSESCVEGNLAVHEDFPSRYAESRTLRVWTPENYDPSVKYDVIYMHDGQNLFDSTITWNNQEWGVDEVLSHLLAEGEIRPCIVVGIDNTSLRYEEYYPSAICDDVPEGVLPDDFRPLGDEYLRFVVEEVKPWVDSLYPTWGDPAHTFIMGSSCGGLISSYALCRYPEVFGGAACLSTHCSLMNPYVETDQKPAADAYLAYLEKNLPADPCHILYMDRGDCPIDSAYAEPQAAINSMISGLDWAESNYMYRFFPGQSHSENDWRSRLDIPVRFLLGTDVSCDAGVFRCDDDLSVNVL